MSEKIESLVAADFDAFYVEKIIGHTGTGKNPKRWKFWIRWGGYEPEDDTMVDWAAVKDLAALNDYSKDDIKHSSHLCRNYLLNKGITRMEWPTQSVDLNPIENL